MKAGQGFLPACLPACQPASQCLLSARPRSGHGRHTLDERIEILSEGRRPCNCWPKSNWCLEGKVIESSLKVQLHEHFLKINQDHLCMVRWVGEEINASHAKSWECLQGCHSASWGLAQALTHLRASFCGRAVNIHRTGMIKRTEAQIGHRYKWWMSAFLL